MIQQQSCDVLFNLYFVFPQMLCFSHLNYFNSWSTFTKKNLPTWERLISLFTVSSSLELQFCISKLSTKVFIKLIPIIVNTFL